MPEAIPTGRELEALKILWDRGSATVREVYEALQPRQGELAYTTALSLMQTMEQKGLVGHRRKGKAYVYFARIRREATFKRLTNGFVDRVFDGALDEFVARALEARKVDWDELEKLESMIADAKSRMSRKKEES